jgi:hypothetical protein
MTRAPEAVDKAVDAVRRAEHKLVESASDVATKTRRTRRKLAKKAKATRKDVAKTAKSTGKDLARNAKKAKETAQHLAGVAPKRRRRWPWLLALLAAAAGTAAVLKAKSGQQEPFTPEPRPEDEPKVHEAKQQENGHPQPTKPATQPKQ